MIISLGGVFIIQTVHRLQTIDKYILCIDSLFDIVKFHFIKMGIVVLGPTVLGLVLDVSLKESGFVDGLMGFVIDLGLVLTSALIGIAVASKTIEHLQPHFPGEEIQLI